jgi:hypothetical protein
MNENQIQELIHQVWFAVKRLPDIDEPIRDYVLLRLEEAATGLSYPKDEK